MISSRSLARSGITLVEVLVVFAALSVLAGLSLPALFRAQERAHLVACRNNLRQLALAVHEFHEQKRAMPPYASGKNGEVFGSWFIHLMPYLEQGQLYNTILLKERASKGKIRLIT